MRTLLAALLFTLTPALAWSQNHGACPCHNGGGQCVCQPASRCPNCPPQGRAAPAAPMAYRAAGYDSRLVQVRPGERIVLACAPALRVVPAVTFEVPTTRIIEVGPFFEVAPPVYFEAPRVVRTYVPPVVYRAPVRVPVTYQRTVTRSAYRCVGSF